MTTQLRPDAFNALLNNLGQAALWRPALLCPCRTAHSGAAQPSCPTCHGRGVIWQPARPVRVALAGLKTVREWRDFGLFEAGDVILTIPADSPFYAAGENDQITLTDSSIPWSAAYVRGTATERWPPHVVDVETVLIRQADGTLLPGPPPHADPAGGPPAWPPGTDPGPGTAYSVRGRIHPTYFLFADFPQDRAHHGGLRLPRRVVARRFDLFGR